VVTAEQLDEALDLDRMIGRPGPTG
jgi:hypothetical protein